MSQSLVIATSLLALGIALKLKEENQKKKKKKKWIRKMMQEYATKGSYETVYREWRESDSDMYRTMLRLYPEDFEELLKAVDPLICKQDTIPSEKRLAITLRYLVTNQSFQSLSGTFCVSTRSIRRIVPETCVAIIRVLRPYIKTPSSNEEWMKIADDYWQKWDYPCCIGALDGKHVLIEPPNGEGSQNSIVLMALVSADLKFTYADVGMNGIVSDRGVWARSSFRQKLESGDLNLPDSNPFNFHMVGDAAFPLGTSLMRPYNDVALKENRERLIFNYRHSRASKTSENAFGILVHRFEIYRAPIQTSPENVLRYVLATLALHNWLMTSSGEGPLYKDDCPASPASGGILGLTQQIGNRSSNSAQEMRESLCKFFNNEGQRNWQNDHI